MADNFFRINSRRVIHETFDDEVVIVNLETGSYYSLDHVGAMLWHLLEQGTSQLQVTRNILARYQGNALEMTDEVHKFLAELVTESLILASEESSAERAAPISNGEPSPFVKPVLNKYTDMEELLLLDPIHEVDELGWPTARTDLRE